MTGRLKSPAAGFDEGIRGDIQIAPNESGNGTWDFDVNQFIRQPERMYALRDSDRFEVEIDSISYADGTQVKREE
jgi:hypothetical protein